LNQTTPLRDVLDAELLTEEIEEVRLSFVALAVATKITLTMLPPLTLLSGLGKVGASSTALM